MNIEEGKRIFYQYNGSKMYIDREVGKAYRKCEVPFYMEELWKEDIMQSLRKQIEQSKGSELISTLISYTQLLSTQEAIDCITEVLSDRQLDTFSRIILCESLKQLIRYPDIDNEIKNSIVAILKSNKEIMLSDSITIDDSYIHDWRMRNYDFSESNIIRRINEI